MKYLLILTFIACSKTTIVNQQWRRSEWCDTVKVHGDPFYCDSLRDCYRVDTVQVVYNAGDPNGIYPLLTLPPIMDVRAYKDSLIRKYCRYLNQVK